MARRSLLLSVLLLAAVAAAACDLVGVRGSGNLVTESRAIEAFDSIRISNALHAEITVEEGAGPALEITIDTNLMEDVVTEVRQGTLVIEAGRNIRPSSGHVIRITTSTLSHVDASGATRVEVRGEGITDPFALTVSGASRVTLDAPLLASAVEVDISGASTATTARLDAETVDAAVSGASTLEASGAARTLQLNASGASTVRMNELESSRAQVTISGATNAHVRATEEISGSASGASTLHVHGNPALGDFETTGASSVRTED